MSDSHDARRPLAWLGALAAIALALGLWGWLSRPDGAPPASSPAPTAVGQATAIERTVSETLTGMGDVQALESLELSSLVTERITAIHFDSGERVEAGELLIQLDDRHERQQLRAARTVAEQEQREFERLEPLAQQGAIASRQVDEQRNRLDNARAEVERLRIALDDRAIQAPVSGVTGFRELTEGEMIGAGTPLVSLDHLERVYVDFPLPERELPRVATGMAVRGESIAWPERVFEGEVDTVDPRLDSDTRTLTVRARFDNPALALRPGMLLEVTLMLPPQRRLIVPEGAIMREGSESWVFALETHDDQRRARRVPVRIAQREPGWVAIEPLEEGALAPGAQVAISGLRDLGDGHRVVLDDSAARDTRALFEAGATAPGDDT